MDPISCTDQTSDHLMDSPTSSIEAPELGEQYQMYNVSSGLCLHLLSATGIATCLSST